MGEFGQMSYHEVGNVTKTSEAVDQETGLTVQSKLSLVGWKTCWNPRKLTIMGVQGPKTVAPSSINNAWNVKRDEWRKGAHH